MSPSDFRKDPHVRGSPLAEFITICLGLAYTAGLLATRYPMLDVILIAAGLFFFVVSIGYVIGCDRL